MAISIDAVSLPDLVIEGEFDFTGVRAEVALSLGGTPIVWEDSVQGKPIDLVGGNDTGWIDRSTLVSLLALAAVAGATYTLTYESDTYNVRFRHEEAPAIEATPIIPRPNPDGTDWYNNVRIKLMEV
jgi:hypothetical protein